MRDLWAEDFMDPYLVLAWCFIAFVVLLVIGLLWLWRFELRDVARREKMASPDISS